MTVDDVMEFLVAGASAVQIGTANFYNPAVSQRLVSEISDCLMDQNCHSVSDIIGSIHHDNPTS